MDQRIIITASERIACPKCSHEFSLDEGITRQTIDRYQGDFERAFEERRRQLESTLAQEAESKAVGQFHRQIEALKEQLSDSNKAAQDAKEAIAKARADARAKAADEYAAERRAFTQELEEKNSKLKEFQEQELELRKRTREIEEREASLALEFQRKLDEERQKLAQQIGQREAERFSLVEAEYKKKIEDAQRVNEDLRQKLEQGSQQLQCEVLELEVEHVLASAFGNDLIEEVKKGQRGADVIQTVRMPTGQACGRIIWEAKRAEHWSDKWLAKLRDDQREAKAEIAVLVATAAPNHMTDPFGLVGGVWVVAPHLMRPLAETLRASLIEIHKLRLANTGRTEKVELLFNYVSSPAFVQQVRSVVESVTSMNSDLAAEKRAVQRMWAKRQTQIDNATATVAGIVGEISAITQGEIPQLEAFDALVLAADEVSLEDEQR